MVTCGDECWVRLFDKASSELFAECPIPLDKPLITVSLPCTVGWHRLGCMQHLHLLEHALPLHVMPRQSGCLVGTTIIPRSL